METKEKLTEIIGNVVVNDKGNRIRDVFHPEFVEKIVENLIKHNTIVPPCKVGDKTFLLLEKIRGGHDIVESYCVKITDNGYGKYFSMAIDCVEIGNSLEFDLCDFGKTVFLTREEAEAALKEKGE